MRVGLGGAPASVRALAFSTKVLARASCWRKNPAGNSLPAAAGSAR